MSYAAVDMDDYRDDDEDWPDDMPDRGAHADERMWSHELRQDAWEPL